MNLFLRRIRNGIESPDGPSAAIAPPLPVAQVAAPCDGRTKENQAVSEVSNDCDMSSLTLFPLLNKCRNCARSRRRAYVRVDRCCSRRLRGDKCLPNLSSQLRRPRSFSR